MENGMLNIGKRGSSMMITIRNTDGGNAVGQLTGLVNGVTGYNWVAKDVACENQFQITGDGSLGAGWTADSSDAQDNGDGTETVKLAYRHPSGLLLQQHIAFSGVPAGAMQHVTLRNAGDAASGSITSFTPIQLRLNAADPLTVYSLRRDQYALLTAELTDSIKITAGNWNAPEHAGMVLVENKRAGEYLFICVAHEKEWTLHIDKKDNAADLYLELNHFECVLQPGEAVQSPMVFYGTASGSFDDALNKMHRYMRARISPPDLKDFPWVVYDIWSTDSDDVEGRMLAELDFAHDIGVEVFYHDASWWAQSSMDSSGIWGKGLGNYLEDRRKYPHGLAALSEKVHDKGMKFGLWVDPMIIDAYWVDNGTIPEKWLVAKDGEPAVLAMDNWPKLYHICPACPEAADYIIEKLSGIVQKYQLDWLKWDDSAFSAAPRCTRADHGHQPGMGNYLATQGKYRICEELLRRHPDLVIEECGYPARLDYGLAPYIRTNWLSDATTPSSHVRMNMEFAGMAYAASYCLAQIILDEETMKTTDPVYQDTIVRSRMMGIMGMGTLNGKLSERLSLLPETMKAAMKRNIALYKTFRHLLSQDTYRLVPYSEAGWQAIEYATYDKTEAAVLVFRNRAENTHLRLCLKGLDADANYRLAMADNSEKEEYTGKALMAEGIAIELAAPDASEIVFVKKV